tara:strand:- start:479 stop:631 length:153 start_codon:yes stop_codon:yes gene_type:complete
MILLSLLAGCLQLSPKVTPHNVDHEKEEFQTGKYVPKIKTFLLYWTLHHL